MNVATKRWEEGLPIELETLALKVVNSSKRSNTNSDFIKSYCNNDDKSKKKLNVIIKRVLARHGLTVRKKHGKPVHSKGLAKHRNRKYFGN